MTTLDVYGKQGWWIDMLQDFEFKIIHIQAQNIWMWMHLTTIQCV
jgi:hypothetical protein